ncbi:hypothetical protein [Streptomyces acidiscabies]|uniref:hypothetical protein n=1 Tax=Streptomyces acidiscabies TaxID=42234 RepID=UPI0009511587|nr:hypothetical protein [Streptomyces acidiscabies]
MDHQNLSAPASAQVSPNRRPIAVGFIRRLAGRTLTVRVTQAGVTGTITPTRADRVAELHRPAREDYVSNANRRAEGSSNNASLIAYAIEAVSYR